MTKLYKKKWVDQSCDELNFKFQGIELLIVIGLSELTIEPSNGECIALRNFFIEITVRPVKTLNGYLARCGNVIGVFSKVFSNQWQIESKLSECSD